MIKIKNKSELALMREAGKITAGALAVAKEHIVPGVSLLTIDKEIRRFIEAHSATPSFLGYGGFPASACISLNSEVIHGIPDGRTLREGDVVKIDVGAFYRGYHGDAARTYFCGPCSDEAVRLERVTRESFFKAMEKAFVGNRIGDLSHAVEEYAQGAGYSVVREYVGHGVGEKLHEDPEVPNFGRAGRGVRLYEGMTIAVEPMINEGSREVKTLSNQWTVVTCDGRLSAHYENTVVITDKGPELLTVTDGEERFPVAAP